jgi:actin-related protein 9
LLILLRRHLLFRLMPLRPSLNDSPILLALPAPVSRAAHSIITRVFFELFNAPSLSIVETPLLSSYACGTLSSVVVDVGWESCSVSPVLDCAVQHAALTRCNVGLRHCALYLAHLLRRDASLTDALIKLDSRHAASTSRTGESASDAQETLHQSFAALALQLIHEKHARFEAGDLPAGAEQQNDDEEFDVAAALIAGREKAAIEEQEARNKAALAGSDPEAQAIAAKAASQASKPSDDVQPGANDEEGAVQTVFRGVRLQVGPGPLGQVAEPLFNPAVLANVRGIDSGPDLGQRCFGAGSLPDENIDLDAMERAQGSSAPAASRSLPELISIAIASIPEDDKRALLWETLVVTGAPTIGLKGLAGAVTAACANYVASASSNSGGGMGMMTGGMDGTPGIGAAERSSAQPTNVRSLRVPDYFAEFKERTDLAPFLGATIYGKVRRSPVAVVWHPFLTVRPSAAHVQRPLGAELRQQGGVQRAGPGRLVCRPVGMSNVYLDA